MKQLLCARHSAGHRKEINKMQILPSKPAVQLMSVFNSIVKDQVLFFFISSVTTIIPSHLHCCYLMLAPNFMLGSLQSFPNDLLFTLLSFLWLIFNLASWSILNVVTILIFLKCDYRLFPSNRTTIRDNPAFYFY